MVDRADIAAVMKHARVYLFPWGPSEPTIDEMVAFALRAEELGFEAVHMPWHYTMPTVRSFRDFGNRYLLDPTVVVPALAQATSRIKIALEFVVPAVHPFHWAQYFAALDRISNGRALAVPVLGWWEDDFKVGQAQMNERGRRMDEALANMVSLWAGEPIREAGRYWDCTGLELNPRPIQQPFPMWIGGGEKSIDRAARYAQALYPLYPTPQETRDTWIPILQRAEQYGRSLELAVVNYSMASDDAEWLKDYAYPRLFARLNGLTLEEAMGQLDNPDLVDPAACLMFGDDEQCARRLGEHLDAGTNHIVIDFYMHGWESTAFGLKQMERFANRIVPRYVAQ